MFNLNEKVIYPGHGVAIIDEIIEKSVGGVGISFFKLSFIHKDMSILIPLNNLKNCGVRYPSDKTTVDLALNELYKVPTKKLNCFDFTPSGWNRRNKEYQLKIQGGNLIEIIKVYKELMLVAQQKDLSFGEKTLLQAAEDLIVQEIQLVTNKSREYIVHELQEPLKQFFFGQTPEAQVSSAV